MQLFSSCSGPCILCSTESGCIAGHGDDYFSPASKERLISILKTEHYGGKFENRLISDEEYRTIKEFLLIHYNYSCNDSFGDDAVVYVSDIKKIINDASKSLNQRIQEIRDLIE